MQACPRCSLELVDAAVRCTLCGQSLVEPPNVRRFALWGAVVAEYAFLVSMLVRHQ